MTIQDLIDLDGKLELYAQNGKFLGLLSSQKRDPNSIINPLKYGNANYINSIYYEYGIYGGEYGLHSPYNRHCWHPPVIVLQQHHFGLVTKNQDIKVNNLTVIDPDLIIRIYKNISMNQM